MNVCSYMLRNEQFIKRSADWPAIAIFESELKLMQNLVLVVHNFGPGDCDGIHKESVSRKMRNASYARLSHRGVQIV